MRVANTEAFEKWNGTRGEQWADNQSRFDATVRRLTPRLLDAAAIEPGSMVIDVGCGCADTSRRAATLARTGRVLGIDLSAQMIERATELARREGLTSLEFVQADAQTHAFPPSAADVVLSRFGTTEYADPPATFANLRTALRPGGRLAFLCWQGARANEVMALPYRVLADIVPGLPRELPETLGPFISDPAPLRALLTEVGFEDVQLESLTEPLCLGDTADEAITQLRASGPAQLLLGSLDPATASQAWAAVRAALDERRVEDGVWLGSATWLVTARR